MSKAKVAIVTGASRGIGAATAKLLAAQGTTVAVNHSRSRERGEHVVAEITGTYLPINGGTQMS